jgi:hypothetical protein
MTGLDNKLPKHGFKVSADSQWITFKYQGRTGDEELESDDQDISNQNDTYDF